MTDLIPLHDRLTPFMLEGGQVRGRMVRLGDCAETILTRYDYPEPVARMLGELLVAASMLSSTLKVDGIFTIQVRGNGLVPLVVVDAVHGGALRGYAEVPEASRAAIEALSQPTPRDLVGADAYLAITLDPGAGMQRYQGIVALEGDSIADAFTNYFTQSVQLDVQVQITLARGERWAAGGLIIERLPESGGSAPAKTDDSADGPSADSDEHWRYARAVAATVTDGELLDPLLDAPTLLYRLFHEEGVWVYDAMAFSVGCRCSRDRIEKLLMSMSELERADMVVGGTISVHCQFCNKAEHFSPEEVGLLPNQ